MELDKSARQSVRSREKQPAGGAGPAALRPGRASPRRSRSPHDLLPYSTGTEGPRLTARPFGETHTNQGTKDFERRRLTGRKEDPEAGS
jgi:hypothetical protein